jgi:hypothetical protein
MSKKNGNNEETAVMVANFEPTNDVPDKAPAPKFDPTNPNLTFEDVQPSNYFSMESLQEWLDERGGESRILTIVGASTEFVFDPEKGVETGQWKPCPSFEETDSLLVINVSRNQQLKKLTKSPFMRDWAKAGQIAIKPGIANGKAQIVIQPVDGLTGEEIDDAFSYG